MKEIQTLLFIFTAERPVIYSCEKEDYILLYNITAYLLQHLYNSIAVCEYEQKDVSTLLQNASVEFSCSLFVDLCTPDAAKSPQKCCDP